MANRTDDFKISNNVKKARSDVAIDYFLNQKSKARINCGWQHFHHIWNIPSLDLTPKIYHQAAKQKCTVKKFRNNDFKEQTLPQLSFPQICENKREENKMVTRFRVLTANTDRRKTFQTGYHEKEQYRQPRPHHFNDDIHRPLDDMTSLDKQEFKVYVDHDPFNIHFKNETLKKTISELSVKHDTTRVTTGPMETKFDTPLKWDQRLIHRKNKYMNGRDPKEVFFDKVEDVLGWIPDNERIRLRRPDIYDNQTKDLLEITRTGPRHS